MNLIFEISMNLDTADIANMIQLMKHSIIMSYSTASLVSGVSQQLVLVHCTPYATTIGNRQDTWRLTKHAIDNSTKEKTHRTGNKYIINHKHTDYG